jgi:transposase
VADSALYTAETLQQLGGFGWISRVPETLTLAREMTLAVASDLACNPEPLSYRAICVTYAGIRQRWLVVHTHAARQRAEKTLRKQHLTLSEAESKAFKSLQGQTFACEADATAALQAFCQTLKLTEVHEPQIIASPRRKRGRPGKNQTPATYDYLIQGTLSCPIERYQHKLLRKSCFIVATNELDQAALPDERLLECYKKDQQKVERGFRFLKDPVFLSSTLFLKTPRRIMALMAIMTLCLLVYAAVQWRVRQALQHSQQTYPDQKGKPNPRPTARWVFQSFIDISVLHVSSLKTFVVGLTAAQKALLTLLGDRYVALYANSG